MKQAAFLWPLWPGDEDWFRPLHPGGCVRVTRIETEPRDHGALAMRRRRFERARRPDPLAGQMPCRVVVWGDDDSGMSIDDLTAAQADALLAALPNPLTVAWLTERGFHHG